MFSIINSCNNEELFVLVGRMFILNRGRNDRILLVLVGRGRCRPCRHLTRWRSPAFELMTNDDEIDDDDDDDEEEEGDE